jgi:RNA polymerase sigma-70 factor (ECF subfamily)
MDHENQDHLSRIETFWTVVCRAQEGGASAATRAQEQLLERYTKAAHRYLLGALRDADLADDLTQEFALRFLRGDFQSADPQRGRFRDFVKRVLSHLVTDYYRRRKVQQLPTSVAEAVPAPEAADLEGPFLASWRSELLDRAWKALAQHEKRTGQPFDTVLRFRARHPDLRSAQMAEQLSAQLGKPVTAAWIRQTLHRARDKFGELLLTEVMQTLRVPALDELEQELIDVGLFEYCRPALNEMRGKG